MLLSVSSHEVPLINILGRPGHFQIPKFIVNFRYIMINLLQKSIQLFDIISRFNVFIYGRLNLRSVRLSIRPCSGLKAKSGQVLNCRFSIVICVLRDPGGHRFFCLSFWSMKNKVFPIRASWTGHSMLSYKKEKMKGVYHGQKIYWLQRASFRQ